MALVERDVRLALRIVEAAATQNGSPFGRELLDALLEAIPALTVEYMERQFAQAPVFVMAAPREVWPPQVELDVLLARAGAGYPLDTVEHAASSEPLRISDLVSMRAFRRTEAYAVIMRPFGVEHELKLWLPAPPGHARMFLFARGPGTDFTERDLALLRLVRPHLARLRARWERAPRPAQLTERERDVVELLAQGLTNREIARRLFISPATVRKHLEHVYAKLGVRSRAGAVAAAFRSVS